MYQSKTQRKQTLCQINILITRSSSSWLLICWEITLFVTAQLLRNDTSLADPTNIFSFQPYTSDTAHCRSRPRSVWLPSFYASEVFFGMSQAGINDDNNWMSQTCTCTVLTEKVRKMWLKKNYENDSQRRWKLNMGLCSSKKHRWRTFMAQQRHLHAEELPGTR